MQWLAGGTACAVDVAGVGGGENENLAVPPQTAWIPFKLVAASAMVILWATDSKDLFQVGDCDSHGDLVGHIDLAHHMVHPKKSRGAIRGQPGNFRATSGTR
jgi:hypothetical protein